MRRFVALLILPLVICLLARGPAWAGPPDASPGAGAETAREIGDLRNHFIDQNGDLPMVAVHTEGLHRTKQAVIDQFLHVQLGTPISKIDLVDLYERLYRLAIFSAVRLELMKTDAGVELTVRITEKWTLYPVPLLWLFEGTEVVGVVLAEANAFGLNKGWAIGGVYSNRGWYGIAAYVDPNIAFTNAWGRLSAFVGSGQVENDDREGHIEQSFDLTRVDVQYALGYTLWDRLSPTLTGAMRWGHVEEIHVPGEEPPGNVLFLEQGFKLIYSDLKYRFYYDEGVRFSAEIQHGFPVHGESPGYNGFILDGSVATGLFRASAIQFTYHATVADFPVVFEDRLGGVDGSRTLPGGGVVAADRYFSGTMAFQTPIVEAGFGTLTGVAFLEAGQYKRNAEPVESYGGPGVGLRFYLRNVSIPAVGMDIGYEVESQRVAFSVVVGYRPTR